MATLWFVLSASQSARLYPPDGRTTLEGFLCYGHILKEEAPVPKYYCWCRKDSHHRFLKGPPHRCIVRENGHYVLETSNLTYFHSGVAGFFSKA